MTQELLDAITFNDKVVDKLIKGFNPWAFGMTRVYAPLRIRPKLDRSNKRKVAHARKRNVVNR